MLQNPLSIRPEEKLALRIKEAVAVSGLSRSTIYKLVSEKKLRAVKIGGRRLILREDLQALLHGGIQ
jgi:excisionase family DNA binding protein